MRFSTVAAAILAASPALVSAKGTMGFSLGTKKADGTCKTQQDYADDFDAIKAASGATLVRGYSASDCNMASIAVPAAKAKGFQIMLGIWPDVESSFEKDLSAIVAVASSYADTIHAVTVGSETLYRGNFTGAELADKIRTVKSKLPKKMKVGTAETWNRLQDGTANDVIPVADILLINAFAFWQGASAGNDATKVFFDDVYQAMAHIEKIAGGPDKAPEMFVGETGWPTATGTDYENAKGGLENAKKYYQESYCAILDWGYNAFYFEAFDEPWKPKSVGKDGAAADETTWGAMTSDRKPKFSLKC